MFLKISKELLMQKNIDKRTFLLQMFLFRHKSSQDGRIGTSIDELAYSCGNSPNSHKGRINDAVKQILRELKDRKVIDYGDEIDKVKATTLVKIFYLANEDTELAESFVQFQDYECDRILSLKTNLDKSILLSVYLFIKSHIYQNKGSQFTFLSFYKIRKALNLSGNSTTQNAVKELIKNNMLYTTTLKYLKKQNELINVPTCFALTQSDLAGAESYMRKKFKAEGNE